MFGAKPVLPSGRHMSVWAYTSAWLLFLVATRWPLAPRYLYYFDSANFAFAIEKFNPALHRPQPPGYPWFVALTRILHVWISQPEKVLLIAGLLAAFAAIVLIRLLAADLFGSRAGILAPALLVSDPVFWFAGITNEIRLFLSLMVAAIGFLAWRSVARPDRPLRFLAACATLGIAAG